MENKINKKNEIVNIFNNLRLKHVVVKVNHDSQLVLNGFITKADSNYISIYFESVPDVLPLKKLSISFELNGYFYNTEILSLRALNIPLKSLELHMSEVLYIHSMRKFTRVDLPTGKAQVFISQIEDTEKKPSAGINVDELPATLKKIYLELTEDEPDLKKIIGMIGEELGRFSNRFKINLFKEVNTLNPLEKVVFTYKKTFWISDTQNLSNYVHLRDKYNIIGYEKYFEMIQKSLSPDTLEQVRNSYLSKAIGSYCMVPILIGDRVSGVIEVSVPSENDKFKSLTIYDIFYIKGLADILAEVVVKSKVGKMQENNFEISDISIGGVLAETKNIYLARSLKEDSIVKLTLKLDEKSIEVTARIVRYDYIPGKNAGLNVAFEFVALGESQKAGVGHFIRTYLQEKMKKQGAKE